jgi:hypothetical protein
MDFALDDNVRYQSGRNKDSKLHEKRRINDERFSGYRKEQKASQDSQSETEPIPDKEGIRQLGGRLAPISYPKQANIDREIRPQPQRNPAEVCRLYERVSPG